jgi:2-polyprenyl-3-methyl-5-hydroxy-6-metoxy-1,4-benzoquinol methylase
MRLTEFYDRYWKEAGFPIGHGFALNERKAKLKRALSELPSSAFLLDAGCGNGEFSLFLAQLGYKVVGIDISPVAVHHAKRIVPQGHLVVSAMEATLPFRDKIFSAVWCTEVLEHIFDVHAALKEFNRILLHDGLLVLTTPYHGLIKNLLIAVGGFERHYNPYISHIRFYTKQSLGVCLKQTGFTPFLWQGVGRRWPVWMSHFVVARKTGEPGPRPTIIG